MIRFALRLPADLIFNEGQTKYLLRRVFKADMGLERPKRPASLSPVRLWRMVPDADEYAGITERLRKLYLRLSAQNIRRAGGLSHQLTKTATLGLWLKANDIAFSA